MFKNLSLSQNTDKICSANIVCLFRYGVLTLFGSFNVELSLLDKGLYVWFGFMAHQPL